MSVPLIGLTGGIGAGKSTALEELQGLGAATCSTDALVHALYEGDEVRDAVIARWGAEVAPRGIVDRDAIAKIVFNAPEERQWLEAFIWPLVGKQVELWRAQAATRTPPPPAAVLEVPLLFESGFDAGCDATIAVVTERQVVSARTVGRTLQEVAARTGRQLSDEQKARKATFVVSNDGSLADLRRQLRVVLAQLSATTDGRDGAETL